MTAMPRRYQNGTIEKVKTATGPAWYIRFTAEDGSRPRHRIGLVKDIPTKAKAERMARPIRDDFNGIATHTLAMIRTFDDVIDRYEREEMPERHSTSRGYGNIHRVHIRPKWGKTPLSEVTPMAVRHWLTTLEAVENKKKGKLKPAATRTKGHIHGQMRVLFRFAMMWGWYPAQANPMSLFTIPGSTKRAKTPEVVGPEKFQAMLALTQDASHRAMLIGAYCLGLRVSELFGLRWDDFDWLHSRLWIRRGVVRGREGDVKTERSAAPLPLAKEVMDAFMAWRQNAKYIEPNDWVFASTKQAGLKPMSSHRLQQRWLSTLGGQVVLGFPLGWHTFRHSYKSLLDRVTADATVKRDLMRHADIHTTMQVYGNVEMDRMRTANEAAVSLALRVPAH